MCHGPCPASHTDHLNIAQMSLFLLGGIRDETLVRKMALERSACNKQMKATSYSKLLGQIPKVFMHCSTTRKTTFLQTFKIQVLRPI